MTIESHYLLAVVFELVMRFLIWFLLFKIVKQIIRSMRSGRGVGRRLYENLLIQDAGNFAVQDWSLRPFQFFWRLKNYG
jgi:hypothetical protein